ncbi:TPA: hypothetical protein IAC10_01060 [Candidatus Scatousia excrementigallinarum]|uniref:Uncharacterized protein n=1 Tax=Candidatus Scatousia excrementigallinarum TaxID=2840935 RepID=A0A9D1JLP9_9BACT|nr:hypothetical protein [Candidatus Scatousia excrementigallinarum]
MERGNNDSLNFINEQIVKELQKLDEEESRKLSIKTKEPPNTNKNQNKPK